MLRRHAGGPAFLGDASWRKAARRRKWRWRLRICQRQSLAYRHLRAYGEKGIARETSPRKTSAA
jgi:hypothetical protein